MYLIVCRPMALSSPIKQAIFPSSHSLNLFEAHGAAPTLLHTSSLNSGNMHSGFKRCFTGSMLDKGTHILNRRTSGCFALCAAHALRADWQLRTGDIKLESLFRECSIIDLGLSYSNDLDQSKCEFSSCRLGMFEVHLE